MSPAATLLLLRALIRDIRYERVTIDAAPLLLPPLRVVVIMLLLRELEHYAVCAYAICYASAAAAIARRDEELY